MQFILSVNVQVLMLNPLNLLHCTMNASYRSVFFENLAYNISFVTLISTKFTCDLLLYGDPIYNLHTNKMIPF